MREWIELFRSLGESLLEVLRAELEALQKDFATSGRHFGIALGFFGGAVMLAFWMVGLIVFGVVSFFYIWLPLWASAGIALLLFAAVALVLGMLGRKQLRKTENPIENVRRRVDDHLEWWQRLMAEPKTVDVTPAAEPLGRELP